MRGQDESVESAGQVTFESRDGQTWAIMSGAVDLHVVDSVELDDLQWLMGSDSSVTVDMSGLTFLDSRGISLLVQFRKLGPVELVGVSPAVRNLLQMTGLADTFGLDAG